MNDAPTPPSIPHPSTVRTLTDLQRLGPVVTVEFFRQFPADYERLYQSHANALRSSTHRPEPIIK